MELDECKIITEGARKASHSIAVKDEDRNERLRGSHSTFFDRVYLRKYEPDYVRRFH